MTGDPDYFAGTIERPFRVQARHFEPGESEALVSWAIDQGLRLSGRAPNGVWAQFVDLRGVATRVDEGQWLALSVSTGEASVSDREPVRVGEWEWGFWIGSKADPGRRDPTRSRCTESGARARAHRGDLLVRRAHLVNGIILDWEAMGLASGASAEEADCP